MRKRVFGVLLAAFLVVGVLLSGVALAAPPAEREHNITVTCPNFDRHQGQEEAGEFSQTLPTQAQHGSDTSLKHSAGGEECKSKTT